MTDWLPWADAGEYYAALNNGYFKAAGLNVKIVPPATSGAQEQLVGVGKAQFAIGFLPDILNGQAQGIPLYSIGVTMHNLGSGLFSLKSENITSPADLKGKTIGIPNKPDAEAFLNTLLAEGHLTRNDVKIVDPGYNAVVDVIRHKIDLGYGLTFAEGVQADDALAKAGQPGVNWLLFKDHGVPNFYYQMIVTNKSWVQSHPHTACRFLAALELGAHDWISNPTPTVDQFIKLNNQFTPQEHKQITNIVKDQWMGPNNRLFYQDPAVWNTAVTWALKHGIGSSDAKVSDYFSNKYLPYGGTRNVTIK